MGKVLSPADRFMKSAKKDRQSFILRCVSFIVNQAGYFVKNFANKCGIFEKTHTIPDMPVIFVKFHRHKLQHLKLCFFRFLQDALFLYAKPSSIYAIVRPAPAYRKSLRSQARHRRFALCRQPYKKAWKYFLLPYSLFSSKLIQ